ncbi:THAP domain-containing protein 2-like isoform X2 [Ambystoma mexicanum]|uniref:THAP domain-containing protein 2-like isoform X2 n=1 Tax=Ambystoma mexicanum TaxID=8296 RepID=UPI0037E70C06
MPTYCSAINCKNRHRAASKDGVGRAVTFHKFPKDPARRTAWVAAVRRIADGGLPWSPSTSSSLCSAHFKEEAFDRTGQTVRLRQEAVPTIFNFPQHLPEVPRRKTQLSPALTSSSTEHCESPSKLESSHLVKEWVVVERTAMPEHNYHCSASPGNLKMALVESRSREEILRSKLQMARREERRLQGQVSRLLTQLEEVRGLHEEAVCLLQSYSDLPLELIRRHPEGYSQRQCNFASTLHSYGPKAYEYLQQMGFSLPDPSTLFSFSSETQMETEHEDTDIPGYTDTSTEKTTEEESVY